MRFIPSCFRLSCIDDDTNENINNDQDTIIETPWVKNHESMLDVDGKSDNAPSTEWSDKRDNCDANDANDANDVNDVNYESDNSNKSDNTSKSSESNKSNKFENSKVSSSTSINKEPPTKLEIDHRVYMILDDVMFKFKTIKAFSDYVDKNSSKFKNELVV